METRDYNIETDGVQDNSTDDMCKEWSCDETTPETTEKITQNITEVIGKMVYPNLVKKIDLLIKDNEEKDEQIKQLKHKYNEICEISGDKDLIIKKYKTKLHNLQAMFNSQNGGEFVVSSNLQDFVYDVVHFDEYITIEQINNVFLNLQKLTDIKTAPDQYLINNASAVVPIYLLLTESKKIPEIYRYKGTKSDFCREWNSNVASRIPDKDRSQALTIEYDSFKAECNRAPWKGSSPANWNRDKVDSKHKVKLDRAVNTKKHLERLFT